MKRQKKIWVLAVAFALAVFLFGTANAAEPIKIGAVSPLGDITGKQSTNAMKLAVKEINDAGGLLGRPVELIIVDDEMKPAKGAAAVEKLVTVNKVDFLVGGMSSGVHLGEIPVLKKYKKITVWIGAAYSGCETALGADSDWYFHLHPWDYNQGAGYVAGWTDIDGKFKTKVVSGKQFYAYEEGAFGAGAFKASKTQFPNAEIMGESFKSAAQGGGDYRAILRHAKQAKPDLFIWAGYGADSLPIAEQSKEVGFVPPIFLGSPPGWPVDFGKSPLAEGICLYGMWAPSIKEISPVSKHFWDAYIAMFNEEPATYFCPLGYTNIMFLAEGIKKAGTLEQAKMIAALEQTEYKTPMGEPLKITPSNVIKHQGIKIQKILQYQKGQQEVIWPFEYATAELIYPFPNWGGK